jgi:chaperone modulatory protein CbpM
MRITAVVALFAGLRQTDLVTWIERGWVRPDPENEDWVFHEIDVARVRLIHDLRYGMDLREDAIPLVLSLLDQIYELRGTLRSVLRVVETQPPEVRDVILNAIRPPRG